MQVDNGRIQDMELFKELYDKDVLEDKVKNYEIVSVEDSNLNIIRKWGYKKRNRYAQLLSQGYTEKDAFRFVEYHNGIIKNDGE